MAKKFFKPPCCFCSHYLSQRHSSTTAISVSNRAHHGRVSFLNQLWRRKICALDFVKRWFWYPKTAFKQNLTSIFIPIRVNLKNSFCHDGPCSTHSTVLIDYVVLCVVALVLVGKWRLMTSHSTFVLGAAKNRTNRNLRCTPRFDEFFSHLPTHVTKLRLLQATRLCHRARRGATVASLPRPVRRRRAHVHGMCLKNLLSSVCSR